MSIAFLFHMLFVVGVAKALWDEHKNGIVMQGLGALLKNAVQSPMEPQEESLSKTERQLSGVHRLDFMHRKKMYAFVLPPKHKHRASWTKAVATFEDADGVDVTEIVTDFAGPNRDFYGIAYRASDLVRGATQIRFEGCELVFAN